MVAVVIDALVVVVVGLPASGRHCCRCWWLLHQRWWQGRPQVVVVGWCNAGGWDNGRHRRHRRLTTEVGW